MAEDKNTLELISNITEFNDLHEFMKDDHLDKALAIVVKLLMNPDVPSAKSPMLIMELQAMSTKFAVMASYYSTIAKDKADEAAISRLYGGIHYMMAIEEGVIQGDQIGKYIVKKLTSQIENQSKEQ